jgi:hypothetical protein
MKEVAEFRVSERYAAKLFADSEGRRMGVLIRKVEIETTDPRFEQVGRLNKALLASEDNPFFYGWNITRHPTPQEFEAAELFLLRVTAVFEPAGEECGTTYDESSACLRCGAGARQVGPLSLAVNRIPKGKDIAKTIAGEIVISRRMAEILHAHGFSGADLKPVLTSTKLRTESPNWFQLSVTHMTADIVLPTRTGIDPFDVDLKGEYRCPHGDLLGLALLSDVSISAASRSEDDFICSRQFVGVRRGLLRPERLILVSPKVARLIKSEKIKGCRVEVAYIV